MKKLYRIVKVKNGKNSTNAIIVNSDGEIFKTVFLKQSFVNMNLGVGSTFTCILEKSKNKFTDEIVYVANDISNINNSSRIELSGYNQIRFGNKSIQNKNFRLSVCGDYNLKNWEFRQELYKCIRNKLFQYGFDEYYTPTLMDQRGSSMVSPLVTNTYYQGEKYLKITHESQLKKASFVTLKSLFEIGYLSRNVNNGKDSLLNYLSLEAVATKELDFVLQDFYSYVMDKSIEICATLNIEIKKGVDDYKIVDVLSAYLCTHKEFEISNFSDFYNKMKIENKNKNIIYLNVPVNTPFAIDSEFGIPLETKWYINGSSVGHGYFGETNADLLKKRFIEQKALLKNKNIEAEIDDEFIKLVKYVGIENFSFNLGLDRYIYNIFNFENAKSSSKVLGV